MSKFIRYELNGDVVESRSINLDELTKYSILGQKARITTKDGRVYEGFADEPYLTGKGNSLTLKWYDTDYGTGHLRSSNMVTIFIPLDTITKIEAILHSNPRWGFPPINEFLFSGELKQFVKDYRKKRSKNNG